MRINPPMVTNVHDILYLDINPEAAVKMLADLDVIRMPIYIQQVLETVWGHVLNDWDQRMTPCAEFSPWLVWVREAQPNYEELWNYGMDIIDEHFHRFGSRNMHPYRHGSVEGFNRLGNVPNLIKGVVSTQQPISVDDARTYYHERDGLAWTNREKPEWLNQ